MIDYSAGGKYYFDEAAAMLWIDFFPAFLEHTVGEWAGQPLELDDWQVEDIIGPLFGWKSVETGLRRFRTLYLEVPRKNGKSKLSSGLSLGGLLIDREPGVQIFCVAEDKDQAKIVFNDSKAMVMANNQLKKRVKPLKEIIELKDSPLNFMRVLSSIPDSKHGLNPHFTIIDEVHVQKDWELIDVLSTGRGARRQPLMVYITTAGFDRTSPCWTLHNHSIAVRDGVVVDETWLPVIYAADPEDDPWSEETWKKANPGYGISVKKEFLESEAAKAKMFPMFENTFKRLYLNLWTEQDERWMPMELWDACGAEFTEQDMLGKECYGGLDLATVRDLACFSLLFPRAGENGPAYDVLPYFFVPEEAIERRSKEQGVNYDFWSKPEHGIGGVPLIEKTPGNCIDYTYIRKRINELGQKFKIKEIGYDPFNAYEICTNLKNEDGFEMVEVRQGFITMSPATKRLMTLVMTEHIRHNRHAVLRWNVQNATIVQDAKENYMLSKDKSTEKIDGIVATDIALARAMVAPPPRKPARIFVID